MNDHSSRQILETRGGDRTDDIFQHVPPVTERTTRYFGVDSRSSSEVQSVRSSVYDCYDFYESLGDGWVTLLYGSCYDVFVCYRRVRVIVWVLCGYRRIIIVIAQTLWEITSFAKYFRVALPST